MLNFQLALELIEEAPVRSVSDDLAGSGLDHAAVANNAVNPWPGRIAAGRAEHAAEEVVDRGGAAGDRTEIERLAAS